MLPKKESFETNKPNIHSNKDKALRLLSGLRHRVASSVDTEVPVDHAVSIFTHATAELDRSLVRCHQIFGTI